MGKLITSLVIIVLVACGLIFWVIPAMKEEAPQSQAPAVEAPASSAEQATAPAPAEVAPAQEAVEAVTVEDAIELPEGYDADYDVGDGSSDSAY